MRKAIQIAATFAIIAFGMTSCQKDNVESTITPQNTEKKEVTQDTSKTNLSEATLVAEENVPQNVREGITVSEEEKVFAKNFKSQNRTLSFSKQVRVFANLYCENKGGDDGNTLEIFGNVKVNTINAGGAITAPPIVGSSIFKSGYPIIFIKQGETKHINSAMYRVTNPLNTFLKLESGLYDDDRNSDDGKFPNKADYMGYKEIPKMPITSGVHHLNVRHADGNQIVWVKYTIYVN